MLHSVPNKLQTQPRRTLARTVALSCAGLCAGAGLNSCARAPLAPAVASDTDSVFAYLASRYDKDGDGRITGEESGRGAVEFAQLDRVADGVWTKEDFATVGTRPLSLSIDESRRLRSLHLFAWFLQGDADPTTVATSELRAAFAAYDENGDMRVGRTEFETRALERAVHGQRPSGRLAGLLEAETTDRWERLADAPDLDDDGFITVDEVLGFFAKEHPGGQWKLDPATAGNTRGPAAGEIAPDFELSPPDGGPPVRLSDFRGVAPVALIFGSYT